MFFLELAYEIDSVKHPIKPDCEMASPRVVLAFVYVEEILHCNYSNETCLTILTQGTIF